MRQPNIFWRSSEKSLIWNRAEWDCECILFLSGLWDRDTGIDIRETETWLILLSVVDVRVMDFCLVWFENSDTFTYEMMNLFVSLIRSSWLMSRIYWSGVMSLACACKWQLFFFVSFRFIIHRWKQIIHKIISWLFGFVVLSHWIRTIRIM